MEKFDARIDAYIEKSADFAKPILTHLRQLVHKASPEITETMKWSAPFFEYKGVLCFMMAFKQHAGFGFWKAENLPDPHGIIQDEGNAGSIGKLTTLADLPNDDVLIWYIRQAMEVKDGAPTAKIATPKIKKVPAAATPLATPDYLIELLADNTQAAEHFDNFSPSQKKEYITWFEEAKTEATRNKRLAEGIAWIAEGKTRHWKYK
ncbi:YdeI family protein [Mucilaginibacter lutimaris]|uniref:YdeI family protein n=1 Tax=Mucilaginibacter lutimaris TaxID=931629 RepID=A0ABW2ZFZ0_9SPHI